jgi:hypothetical protein
VSPRFSGATVLIVSACVVCAAIVAGIVMQGSPASQRLRKLDAARVARLSGVEMLVKRFAAVHKALPRDLAELAREPGFSVPPQDPVSAQPFDYEILGTDSYRLCATFETSTSEGAAAAVELVDPTWSHNIGHQCFNRHVDLHQP